jgi:hypothetical protein
MSSSIPVEFMVADPAAAYPTVPWGILFDKARSHEGGRALPGRVVHLGRGGLLPSRNEEPGFNGRHGHELLINESGP